MESVIVCLCRLSFKCHTDQSLFGRAIGIASFIGHTGLQTYWHRWLQLKTTRPFFILIGLKIFENQSNGCQYSNCNILRKISKLNSTSSLPLPLPFFSNKWKGNNPTIFGIITFYFRILMLRGGCVTPFDRFSMDLGVLCVFLWRFCVTNIFALL